MMYVQSYCITGMIVCARSKTTNSTKNDFFNQSHLRFKLCLRTTPFHLIPTTHSLILEHFLSHSSPPTFSSFVLARAFQWPLTQKLDFNCLAPPMNMKMKMSKKLMKNFRVGWMMENSNEPTGIIVGFRTSCLKRCKGTF